MTTDILSSEEFTKSVRNIDPTQFRGPPPRLTVLCKGWFRLLFTPTECPTPLWERYVDIIIHENLGDTTLSINNGTPAWRRAEVQQYARVLSDIHYSVLAAWSAEARRAAESEPRALLKVNAEITGFRVVLLTPEVVEPADDWGPEDPAWLAPARATLIPPNTFELDVPDSAPEWLVDDYRTAVGDIFSRNSFTLSEADTVIRTFALGSPLMARLTMSFDVPDGYERVICSHPTSQGPQRDRSLLPQLARLETGLYRLEFAKSHDISTLTFDLVNKTGTISPDNPSPETLEYLETYLLAMRTVFGDDDGEGEFAALETAAYEEEEYQNGNSESEDPVTPQQERCPGHARREPRNSSMDEEDTHRDSSSGRTATSPVPSSSTSVEYFRHDLRDLDSTLDESTDPAPEPYPIDIAKTYQELHARVSDLYDHRTPYSDQVVAILNRHGSHLSASLAINGPLSTHESEELVDIVEAGNVGLLPPIIRRFYALDVFRLSLWGQDLPNSSERLNMYAKDCQRHELIGAEFDFEDEEVCSICTEVIAPKDALAITPCCHLLHQACLEDWPDSVPGSEAQTCPICRRDFVLYVSLLRIVQEDCFDVAWKVWMGQHDDEYDEEDETGDESYSQFEGDSVLDAIGSEGAEVGSSDDEDE